MLCFALWNKWRGRKRKKERDLFCSDIIISWTSFGMFVKRKWACQNHSIETQIADIVRISLRYISWMWNLTWSLVAKTRRGTERVRRQKRVERERVIVRSCNNINSITAFKRLISLHLQTNSVSFGYRRNSIIRIEID